MSDKFTFHASNDPEVLKSMFTLCGSEWSGKLTPEEFGVREAQRHLNFQKEGTIIHGYYLEDPSTKTIVASTMVRRVDGFYKGADRSNAISSLPDPSLIGVKNTKFLLISFVFTHKDYRKKGLAQRVVSGAIEATENKIIEEKLEKSTDSKDSFKNMVYTDGKVDKQLANYYLSKEYFWFLYSGVDKFYEKFGFKDFPLDFYRIPTSIASNAQEKLLETLLDQTKNTETFGKKLKLLKSSDKKDQDLIHFIFQGKELEILTELNMSIFHSELQGNQKSSSSLTSMSNILQMTQSGSNNALSSITEMSNLPTNEGKGQRRKSSVHHATIPKVALKPVYNNYSKVSGEVPKLPENEFSDIQGAILTNELQQKSHYIVWNSLMRGRLFIIGMGELKFEALTPGNVLGAAPPRRRTSSFTGINELGGYNFQDWDILISLADYVAKKRKIFDSDAVYISVNDVPSTVPAPVLNDYFLNYLPSTFESVGSQDDEKYSEVDRVKFISDASGELGVLPMLKLFGRTTPDFDLDWISSSMTTWG
ncbi:uncharacterized protein RJT20DRAFT_27863 [Scheffersomyces xylosifermentans]|uniref:uncharacterized protein n=1 Tax=Scheffersomyces xylosifermentans TaxID=1304137 RepID=UPI00315D4524